MIYTPDPAKSESRRPGRAARFILFVAAILGSVAFIVVFSAIPVFEAMFADFGSELPTLTTFFISARFAYPPLAMLFGIMSYLLLYGRFQRSGSVLFVLGLLGLEYAVFVMSFAAMFMPILQLGAVSTK